MQMESHTRGNNQGECLRQYLRPWSTTFTREGKDEYEEYEKEYKENFGE